jgi:threonylcarbamoyladenosine tRNA methylthiotransferase MtaB
MRYHTLVRTYHVENFGCRATQADGAALERQFAARGLASAPAERADLVVLNSCTVTSSADQDARAAIRRVRRENPEARIVVTGCYAQRAPEEIAALPGVGLVIGNSHKHELAEIALRTLPARSDSDERDQRPSEASAAEIADYTPAEPPSFFPLSALVKSGAGAGIFVSDIFAHTELLAAPVFVGKGAGSEDSRTRPNLKVQDGCGNRC